MVNKENTKRLNNFFQTINKSMKPKATIPPTPKMSEEMKKEQMLRAAMQKRASLAEAILFNMVQSNVVADAQGIVKIASDIADEFMRVVYGQEITIKEASEE